MRIARRRVIRFLAATLACSALLGACVDGPRRGGAGTAGPGVSTLPSGPAVAPGATARVALLVPLSGRNADAAALGAALQNAARMALSEVGGARIDLRVYDTAGEPGTTASVTTQALADGASLILGPLFSGNASAAGAIASRAGVSVISFSTDGTVAGNGVFVSGYSPEAEASRVIGYARSRGIGSFGVLYPQTPYGRAALDATRDAAGPGAVVAELGYARSFEGIQAASGDFAPLFNASRPGGMLMPESGQGLRTLGAFLDYYGISPGTTQFLGLGQWNSQDTLLEPSLQGGWFPGPDPDKVDAFATRYRATYGTTPSVLASLAYDGVLIAVQALDEAGRTGSQTPFSVEALTRPGGFRGAFGPVRLRADGIVDRGMAILEVGPGGFRVIDPAPGAFGAGS